MQNEAKIKTQVKTTFISTVSFIKSNYNKEKKFAKIKTQFL